MKMKKFISTVLAVVMVFGCMTVPAFASGSNKPVVHPLSEAPKMEHTKSIGPVTFSNYLEHKDNPNATDFNGQTIHVYTVRVGMGACAASNNTKSEWVYHRGGFNASSNDRYEFMIGTGMNWRNCALYPNASFEGLYVKPYAGKEIGNNVYDKQIWEFLDDPVQIERVNDGAPEYIRTYSFVAYDDNHTPWYYVVTVTNRTDYKGDGGSVVTPTTPAPSNPTVPTTPTTPAPTTVGESQKFTVTFSDVKSGDWFYQPVMELAGKGLVGGTTKPVNGVGTYEPHKSMTRAEFTTIIAGYLFPEEIKAYDGPYNSYWYSGIYGVAVDMGLIKTSEFSEAAMNEGTSRQEMALMLVRAMEAMGIDTSNMIDSATIPDFNQVDNYYKDYVRVVYEKGLVGGMDAKGTFAPDFIMNRAQAAAVLTKLVALAE